MAFGDAEVLLTEVGVDGQRGLGVRLVVLYVLCSLVCAEERGGVDVVYRDRCKCCSEGVRLL